MCVGVCCPIAGYEYVEERERENEGKEEKFLREKTRVLDLEERELGGWVWNWWSRLCRSGRPRWLAV